MRGRFFVLLLALAAFVLPAASASTAGSSGTATLSQPLQSWLATADASATFDTIVTFDGRDGFSTLDSMGVEATELDQLPMAFAKLTPAQIRQLAASSSVRSLWHDQKLELYLDESVPLTGADKVQAGSGVEI